MDTGVSTRVYLTAGTIKGTNMPLWEQKLFYRYLRIIREVISFLV